MSAPSEACWDGDPPHRDELHRRSTGNYWLQCYHKAHHFQRRSLMDSRSTLHCQAAMLRPAIIVSDSLFGCCSPNMKFVLCFSSSKHAGIADHPDRPFVIAVELLLFSLAHEITRRALRSGLPSAAQACEQRIPTRRPALSFAPDCYGQNFVRFRS
jgi:hypothetical protein